MPTSSPSPVEAARAVVYLAEATSATETRLLERWVAENDADRGASVELLRLPRVGGLDWAADSRKLAARLSRGDDPLFAPLSVAWLPKERAGKRTVRLRDVIATGNPRRPRPPQQRFLVRNDPERAQVVCGEPARLSELRRAFTETAAPESGTDGLAGFVIRRAFLALARAESHLLGPQYKVPRLVREEIWSSARFRAGLGRLASELERSEADVTATARGCLEEMVAGYGRSQMDLALQFGRFLFRQAYEETLDFDRDEAARVVAGARHHAAVVLPTHRSNFDSGVMPSAWHELGLPPTHTFAGINMAFWPLGPIMRRSGSIFIRRDIRGNPVYRYVLREYLGYLVEKRFHLEWYIEGGRSRTGKLLPPRLGLLAYVIDAYREGRTDDVVLVPASITYDQLREVADFAGEARGAPKQSESIRWLIGFMRGSRGTRYGKIYVRFGEPLSLRNTLGPPTGSAEVAGEERTQALQKIGFEVSWRINQATPVTATALLTLALLGALGRALTYEQVRAAAHLHFDDATERELPMTDSAANLRTDRGVRAALDALVDKNVVVRGDDGPDTVYVIGPDQHLAAAFYRNSIVHHFLDGSITELALVSAAEPGVVDPLETFWTAAIGLRDLLKFEFFFRDKDEFRAGVAAAMARNDPRWQERVAEGRPGAFGLLRRFRLLTAPLTLRSFLEAYSVVALELARRGSAAVADEESFVTACEGYGRQRLLQKRIHSPESVSRHVFRTGFELASNRGLVAAGDDLHSRREAFATETKQLLRRLDAIESMSRVGFRRLLAGQRGATPTTVQPGTAPAGSPNRLEERTGVPVERGPLPRALRVTTIDIDEEEINRHGIELACEAAGQEHNP